MSLCCGLAHAHSNLIEKYFGKNVPMNVSHYIHDLTFGDPETFLAINQLDKSVQNPVAGSRRIAK